MSVDQTMQARLETMRKELSERRARLHEHGRDGVPADFADQVTARENDDVVHTLAVQIDGELRQIGAALARIERGDYGRCMRCGEDIAPARLEAVPFAEHCVSCAS
jgi:DnaK suppressor protein